MPTTVNEVCPIHTWVPGSTTPRRWAAFAPRTVAGYVAVASLSHVPRATEPATTSSRDCSAAMVRMPPVAFLSARRER